MLMFADEVVAAWFITSVFEVLLGIKLTTAVILHAYAVMDEY